MGEEGGYLRHQIVGQWRIILLLIPPHPFFGYFGLGVPYIPFFLPSIGPSIDEGNFLSVHNISSPFHSFWLFF
jgi:hypothetical protein